MSIIVETNWTNKPIYKGVNKHRQALQQACETYSADFIGIFKPLNDSWNWTHFIKLDSPENWRLIDGEVHRLYPEIDRDVPNSMSRLYREIGGLQTPPIRDLKNMRYLVVGLNRFSDIDKGIEYYRQRREQFEGLEGAGLLGLYMPNSDSWNWATIKMYDSISKYFEVGAEFQKLYGRIPELTLWTERIYEKYDPKHL